MNLQEYQGKTARFKAGDVSHKEALAVWALGIAGEAGEVAEAVVMKRKQKIGEELGDELFYVAALAGDLGLSLSEFSLDFRINFRMKFATFCNPESLALDLSIKAARMAELIKKHLGQGHPIKMAAVKELLADLLLCMASLAAEYELTLDAIAQQNIDKLTKRYPNGFSTADSLSRSDRGERA